MNDFFQVLNRAMRDKEGLRIQVTRDGALLKVLVQPLLGEEPDDFDDETPTEAQQVRAALAIPLSLHMDAKSLDEQFGSKVTLYGEARGPLHDSFETLMENLREAGKAGKNAVNNNTQAGKSASPPKPAGKNKAVSGTVNDKDKDGDDEASVTEEVVPAATVAKPATGTIF